MKASRKTFLRYGMGLAAAAGFPAIHIPSLRKGMPPAELGRRFPEGSGITGVTVHDLSTPSLVLDLDIFEENLARMSRHAAEHSIALRPHAKTHKCIEIARSQVDAGALGVCVATIAEAEAMAGGGIGGLLITSEMVGENRIRRLIDVTKKQPDTMSVVDHPDHVRQLSRAATAAGVTLNIMIDIDPAGRRTGIEAGQPAIRLAQLTDSLPGLQLRGIHSYSGASSHVTGFEERKAHSEQVMGPSFETWHELAASGLPVEIFSGGSTGTYNIDPDFGVMTELQVGSYVFMDIDYRIIGGRSGPVYDDFGQSLKVIATVISKNHDDIATVDAGFKAFATDRDFGPEPEGVRGVSYRFGGDEHGILRLENPDREIALGDRLAFVVPHCDPNVNLYDRIYCLRGDDVEAVWPVTGKYASPHIRYRED